MKVFSACMKIIRKNLLLILLYNLMFAAIGIVAGDPKGQLEVLSKVTEKQIEETKEYMNHASLRVIPSESGLIFDICIRVYSGSDSAAARIVDYHTNVVMVKKNEDYLCHLIITYLLFCYSSTIKLSTTIPLPTL